MPRNIQRLLRRAAPFVFIFVASVLFRRWLRKEDNTPDTYQRRAYVGDNGSPLGAPTVAMVIASKKSDNTTWIKDLSPLWNKFVYVADDPYAPFTIPKNKGREAMAYLTYIIDHYAGLADITIFHHANQFQWHNDDPNYDAERLLSNLRLDSIYSSGYRNLRCCWTIGCRPDGINPYSGSRAAAVDSAGKVIDYNPIYNEVFQSLFPGEPVPERIEAPCCAQFAVTAQTIRRRPKADYERYRKWLMETPLQDDSSGRVLEYLWHIIFGKPSVDCPSAKQCYCDLYGLCKLRCESEGVCKGQWKRPLPGTGPHGQW